MNDPLANSLSKVMNSERLGKGECIINPVSIIIKKVFDIFNKNNYIGKYTETADSRGNYIKLNLLGRINKCGVIKPRYPITKNDFEKFEKRFLPAKGFGILILSTPQGIITNEEAKEKGIGGKLIAYCY